MVCFAVRTRMCTLCASAPMQVAMATRALLFHAPSVHSVFSFTRRLHILLDNVDNSDKSGIRKADSDKHEPTPHARTNVNSATVRLGRHSSHIVAGTV